MRLTFASYNIRKAVGLDGRRDPERIMAVLREIDADVVALQEADRRLGRRAAALPRALIEEHDYCPVPLAMTREGMGWHGNLLLARRGIGVAWVSPIALPMLEPRGAVCAELVAGGVPIRVAGMHLCLSGLRRRGQIGAVLDAVGREPMTACPTVLMGDFNQWSSARGAMRELAGWQVLALGRSFPARRPLAPLDRIVASGHWVCESAGVHHSRLAAIASDHLPVFARLRLIRAA